MSTQPDFWPDDVRRQREAEHRAEIMALPKWTLFRAGWLTPSGHVQGGVYYRAGDGCGPTGRDLSQLDVLRRAANDTCYTTQPWAIQVLAEPSSTDRSTPVDELGTSDDT